jgi:hypothetical protein
MCTDPRAGSYTGDASAGTAKPTAKTLTAAKAIGRIMKTPKSDVVAGNLCLLPIKVQLSPRVKGKLVGRFNIASESPTLWFLGCVWG